MGSSNSFYVSLFSNISRDIYENNTHTNFTMELSRPIEQGTSTIVKWASVKYHVHLCLWKP